MDAEIRIYERALLRSGRDPREVALALLGIEENKTPFAGRSMRLCPICEKREANSVTGGTGRPLEILCAECLEARIKADLAQAIETFRHFKDAPGVVIDPDDPRQE